MKRFCAVSAIAAIVITLGACKETASSTTPPLLQANNGIIASSETSSNASPQRDSHNNVILIGDSYCIDNDSDRLCAYINGLSISNSEQNWKSKLRWDEVSVSVKIAAKKVGIVLAIAVISKENGTFTYASTSGVSEDELRTAVFIEAISKLYD